MPINFKKPVIFSKDLEKKFGDFTAVNKVNFEVYPGEIFGFLGPNGSGKTTTIRMMLGLLQPTSGTVNVLGIDVLKDADSIRPNVGYMSQKFSLYNDLTIIQNLHFYGSAYGLSGSILDDAIIRALDMAGLIGKENYQTKNLSGGWRQRLALSAAFLHKPKVLFLDEPTAGVDPVSRRSFWNLLYKLIAQGITVFVTTHYMDEAEHCHRLAFIQHGSIIANGTVDEIKKNILEGQMLEIHTSEINETMRFLRNSMKEKTLPITNIEIFGSMIHVIVSEPSKNIFSVKNKLKRSVKEINQISIIEPTLEDVFIASMQ